MGTAINASGQASVSSAQYSYTGHALYWNGASLLDLGTLAPLEGTDSPVAFDVECFAEDTLVIEPILFLSPDTQVLTGNGGPALSRAGRTIG